MKKSGLFDEYKKVGESPDMAVRAKNWGTAIGLQQVDGLTPSEYLISTAHENIQGKITIVEVKERINSYYETVEGKSQPSGTQEADKVAAHISELLNDPSFDFIPTTLCAIHDRLFHDVFPEWAGNIRKVNITKEEEILNGKTVGYGTAALIMNSLGKKFDTEAAFNYKGLRKKEKVSNIEKFISGIWQIHPFREGNTRTIAVFTIKYLRSLGFDANNDMFERHSKYFRNALVRANYNDFQNNVYATMEYLDKFFGNLLLGENNKLDNDDLVVVPGKNNQKTTRKQPENNQKVLDILTNNPYVSRRQISQKLGFSDEQAKGILNKLKKQNIIRRIGPDKGGYWETI